MKIISSFLEILNFKAKKMLNLFRNVNIRRKSEFLRCKSSSLFQYECIC